MLGHDSLEAQFKLNFNLLHHRKIDFRMFETMMPWEKSIYIDMLVQQIEAENEKAKLEAAALKAQKKIRRR